MKGNCMSGKQLDVVVEMFRTYILDQGWSIIREKDLQNGLQLLVTDGITKVPIDCYTNGNAFIQGPPSTLKTELQTWWQQQQAKQAPLALWDMPLPVPEQSVENPSSFLPAPSSTETKVIPHIGTDEAGKGDYFGPLVIAGVYVDAHSASQLLALGVCDSKQLSDAKILSLAEEIKKICHGHGHIVAYHPERYNQLYQEIPNLNLLLARAHAQVIANLHKRTSSPLALVDQFSHEPLVLAALQKMNCPITVEQRPRAEDDIAVAAASIIARATFVRQIEELSESIGIQLPKGASNPMIVTVGREIVARAGRDALGKVAKLHFKTTQEILQR